MIFTYLRVSASLRFEGIYHEKFIQEVGYISTFHCFHAAAFENLVPVLHRPLPDILLPMNYQRSLGTELLPKGEVIHFLQLHAEIGFLRRWRLLGSAKSVKKGRNCEHVVAAYKVKRR